MEGEPLFAPALLRFQALYPGAYTRVSTSTYEILEGLKRLHEGTEGVGRTLPGDTATDLFQCEVTPP